MVAKRPALRYFGGKWRLAPWIISLFPDHVSYIEPFGGGASVLIQKPRSHVEIYNDLDGEIVNFFRVLRNPEQANELVRRLRLTPFARDEFLLAYEPTGDQVERARRTAILSMMSFGSTGIFKNTTGFRAGFREWKTPADDWAGYPDHLLNVIERFQGVVIENIPYQEIFERYDREGALWYLDPPYPKDARDGRNRDIYRHEMTDDDHRELASLAKQLQGVVIISGYRCDLYDELFADWRKLERDHYSASNTGRVERTEVLWFSPNYRFPQKTLFDLTRPNK